MIYLLIDNTNPEYSNIISDCTSHHNISTNIGITTNGIYTIIQIIDASWLVSAAWINSVTQIDNSQANYIVSSWYNQ